MRQNNCNLVRVSLCGNVKGSVLWLGQVSCFCGELQAQNMVKCNRAPPVCSVVCLRLKLDDSTTSDFVVEQCIGLWNFQLRIWSEVFKLNRCSQDHQKLRRKNFHRLLRIKEPHQTWRFNKAHHAWWSPSLTEISKLTELALSQLAST